MKSTIFISTILAGLILISGCGCNSSNDKQAETISPTSVSVTTEPITEPLTAGIVLSDDYILPDDSYEYNEESEDDYTPPIFDESEDIVMIDDNNMTVR